MRWIVRPALFALWTLAAATAAAQGQGLQPPTRAVPLEVTVNGAKGGTWLFVERSGVLHAPRDAFEEWRLQWNPDAASIDFRGERYWPLSAIPGFRARVDLATQSVELLFAPEAFSALRLGTETVKRTSTSPVLPSAFLNYDFNYTGSLLRSARTVHDAGLLTEIGVSGSPGVFTTTSIARYVTSEVSILQPRRFLRLESTFTRDFPQWNQTLRVGDTASRPTMWGRQVYFGGVQYGTNFALTPGMITQPLPTLRGVSTTPSTVQLYVNDVLRQVSNVPTGPFALDNFPLISGGGEARLVVRDLLGRETVLVQPFFTDTHLLAPGLNDWTVSGGWLRRDLGISRDSYGPGFAAGTWRRGITPTLTLEGRAEATHNFKSAGVGAAFGLPFDLLGTLAFAGSDTRGGNRGWQWLAGIERQSLRNTFAFQALGSNVDFRLLGDESQGNVRRQYAGNWSYYTDRLGTFGLGFAHVERFGEPTLSTVSANYSIDVWRHATLNVTASRAVAGEEASSVGVSLVMPLDDQKLFSSSMAARNREVDAYAAMSRSPVVAESPGWRVLAGYQNDSPRAEAGVYYQGTKGNLTGEVSSQRDRTAVRAGAMGGLVVAEKSLFVTRRIDQSYALVEVEGYPNVGVGIGGAVTARTNARGVALVPNLWPYQVNSVRLDPKDLPVSAELDSIEMQTVPRWKSATKAKFPVRSGQGALVRILLGDGQPAPAGATVQIERDTQQFYVARRGEAFMTGLSRHNLVRLKWKGQSCLFEVAVPPKNPDEVPRIGPVTCLGVPR